MFVFALVLLAFHNHQGIGVVRNSAGLPVTGSSFLAAMFMSLFVIYGFDTASTLAEETRDPRRAAPKAVLYSVIGAFIIGGVFLLATLMRIPHLGVAVKNAWGPALIIQANFSSAFATIYLLVVSAAIFVCCLSILAATIRLCFGMARDNQLPVPRPLARVFPSLRTPVWACIVVALLAAVPFIKYSGAGIIAIAATGMIYLSYFLGNIAIMRARTRGWPRAGAPFRLGTRRSRTGWPGRSSPARCAAAAWWPAPGCCPLGHARPGLPPAPRCGSARTIRSARSGGSGWPTAGRSRSSGRCSRPAGSLACWSSGWTARCTSCSRSGTGCGRTGRGKAWSR